MVVVGSRAWPQEGWLKLLYMSVVGVDDIKESEAKTLNG